MHLALRGRHAVSLPSLPGEPVSEATRAPSAEQRIERVAGLSLREFLHEFAARRQPVILTDATADWHARHWTPRTLQAAAGHRRLTVRTEEGPREWRFGEVIERILASTVDAPAPYARNMDVQHSLPELWGDIRPRLKYALPDWKSSRLLPRDFVFPNAMEELFVGGPGASFPRLHVDYWGMDGFVSQMYGEKEFILISPQDSHMVYPSPEDELTSLVEDIDAPDPETFPLFRPERVIRVMLRPGETLYNPNGWWHTTYMPETSITVITAAWNRYNWGTFLRHYRRRARCGKVRKGAMLAYLAGVGAALSLRDLFTGNGPGKSF
jgi:histone arginine demethylase JMJD6